MIAAHKKISLLACAVFVLSFIPNPFFDVAGILSGSLKLNVLKFLFACIMGRILRFLLLGYLGILTISFL